MNISTTEINVEIPGTWLDVASGNVNAFETLYHRHYPDLLRLSYHYLGDEPTAKDIVQDVFLSIWEKRKTLKIRGSIRSYLLTACRNASLNHLKRKASTWQELDQGEHLESSIVGPEQSMAGKELQHLIQKALDQLPPRCRIVFMLKREEGLTLKEIAQQLDISPKTVENQMTRALKSLASALADHLTNLLIFFYAVGDLMIMIV